MVAATRTEIGGPQQWLISDQPDQFRLWGSSFVYPFPTTSTGGIIGSGDGCWLQIQDQGERISRQHAHLKYDDGGWSVSDLRSKNGIYEDGSRRTTVHLLPGVELGLGGITLIAESPMLLAFREVLARLLGWADSRRAAVDLALRTVRLAVCRRESLQLCGEGDLTWVARLLHRYTLGEARPFIVCDPRRRRADASARGAANYASGLEALAAAAGGTLCIWQSRRPHDFDQVIEACRQPSSRVQLIVCTHALQPGDPLIATPIVLPPLSERRDELERIIDAYAADAGTGPSCTLTPVDREWIIRCEATSLPSIEKATGRLVALRMANGSVTRAAAQLGMAHGALGDWISRRTLDYGDDESDA